MVAGDDGRGGLGSGRVLRCGVVVLLVNVAAGWFMAGLIWVIQLVHYAQFNLIGPDTWAEYHRRHTGSITLIVGPVMLVELVTAIWLCVRRPAGVPAWMLYVSLAVVVLMWLSTAALQVPAHNKLAAGYDESAYRLLLHSNWLRTVGWTGRAVLVTAALYAAVRPRL